MPKFAGKSIVVMLVAALVLIPFGSAAMAQDGRAETEKTTGKMALDLLLVRPAGILATLFGSAVFIIGIPFSALGGNTRDTYEKLVVEPAKYTFKRPLGDL